MPLPRFALTIFAAVLAFSALPARAQNFDPAFSPNPDNEVFALARQPDGGILVGGRFSRIGGTTHPNLARLTAAGALDPAFNPAPASTVYAIALQPDGKILIGGVFSSVGGSARSRLARLNANGTVDLTFNASLLSSTLIRVIVPLANGQILIGGNFGSVEGRTRGSVARLNADGSLDPSFTADITGNVSSSPNADVFALALQPDGTLLVGGQYTGTGGLPHRGLARFRPNGTFDPTLDLFPSSGNVYGIALQPDGKILISGSFTLPVAPFSRGLARLNADGTPDVTFGASTADLVITVALQPDGKILAGGIISLFNSTPRHGLVRLFSDGSLDPSFPEVTGFGTQTYVNTILAPSDGTHLFGGVFGTLAGQPAANLGRLLPPPPQLVTSPIASIVTTAGKPVTLSASATGLGLTYQWRKNGAALPGATAPSLTFASVAAADAGVYDLVVTNSAGSLTTSSATLTVITAPAITAAPASVSVAAGVRTVFSVTATGTTPFAYQWFRDGAPIPGATAATLVLDSPLVADSARYSVSVGNSAGTITSDAATLAVAPISRISNLSVLTTLAKPGDTFTLGYVVGGASTLNSKPLILRAAGPSLAALGLTDLLADPQLQLFASADLAAFNDNWNGATSLSAAFTAVGAFPYASANSKDSALLALTTTRDNSLKVSSTTTTGTGAVIAEIYDATPDAAFTVSTPRLLNVSVIKPLGDGLTVGFTLAGSASKTILIRAIGPSLSIFGLSDVVADPQLVLNRAGVTAPLATNDNWSGASALSTAFTAVGAFDLSAASKDAALLATLPPGGYTAQVSGVASSTSVVLVEIYEVP